MKPTLQFASEYVSPPKPDLVPSRERTWKVKPYVPSLAMRLAQERAKADQPPLKSLTSDAVKTFYYDK